MKKQIITIGSLLTALTSFTPVAFAETAVTMNQPDNGFYEGPDPEWATLHSTDNRGTVEHRQYHRDGVQAHTTWHNEHRMEQGTAAHEEMHRIAHQDRNLDHRSFHTDLELVRNSTPATASNVNVTTVVFNTDPVPASSYVYTGRPSRRAIIAEAAVQNSMRSVLQ